MYRWILAGYVCIPINSCLKCIFQTIYFHFKQTWYSLLGPCTCKPIPFAPHPIRVQSCVCCLYWTNRNSMNNLYLSIYLIIQLSNKTKKSQTYGRFTPYNKIAFSISQFLFYLCFLVCLSDGNMILWLELETT